MKEHFWRLSNDGKSGFELNKLNFWKQLAIFRSRKIRGDCGSPPYNTADSADLFNQNKLYFFLKNRTLFFKNSLVQPKQIVLIFFEQRNTCIFYILYKKLKFTFFVLNANCSLHQPTDSIAAQSFLQYPAPELLPLFNISQYNI